MTTENKPHDVYEIVTTYIISQLELGKVPWQKPWTQVFPQNLISGRQYRGLNVLLLASLGYSQNYFITFNQLSKLGGKVLKGEKPHPIIYWEKDEKQLTLDGRQYAILQNYSVYNIAQCDVIEYAMPRELERVNTPIEFCEKIVAEMPNKPEIKSKENRPFYHPYHDFINMPKRSKFNDAESYYDTLFKELVHSTGHVNRLKRREVTQLKSLGCEPYSIEELIAEIGACYLNSYAGIAEKKIENNEAYIKGWLDKLNNDKRLIVFAASKAQRAVDYILNVPGWVPEGVREK